MAQVTLADVRKSYGQTIALEGFSVTVADGEFVTFLGPSGCGKTTSLRLVAGFIRPDQGSIRIGEHTVSELGVFVPPEERGVGMVFQSYAVWPHMNVFRNVAYPLRIKKIPRAETIRRVEQALELVKMPELIDRYPNQLSGGQQQRVALARALVMQPKVLLLDEPFSNLDAKLREEMRFELKALQKQTGITIIFVTHDQLEAMVLSDRVVVMESGVIQQIGTPREIYQQPANQFVADFIGTANFLEVEIKQGEVFLVGGPSHPLSIAGPQGAKGRVRLMVRPEEVQLNRREGALEARIEQKMFLGDAMVYLLNIHGQMLKAKSQQREEFDIDERIYVQISGDRYFS
ncbi:MAG: ABC transporter ATP-binding protein [Spirochaetaceae bacterium]|nr:MAG: ABC transporter ATP-binding protein [Spirochaetaceae bacterium]